MSATDEEVRSFWEKTLGVSSKMIGGVGGAAVGLALGVPLAGALISPYFTNCLETVGKEVMSRQLGPRQEVRAGAAIILAAQAMKARSDRGDQPRQDDFFDQSDGGCAAADEVTEAALNAAINSFEERKVPYVANLLANVCYDSRVDRAMCHALIEMANKLSYRSLVLLSIFCDVTREVDGQSRGYDPISTETQGLLIEVYGLIQLGLVSMVSKDNSGYFMITSPRGINPTSVRSETIGYLLTKLMQIENIGSADGTRITISRQLDASSNSSEPNTVISGGRV
jgi:hypothetical protein